MKFYKTKRNHKDYNSCDDCGVKPFTQYMVRYDLWEKIAGTKRFLCLSCFSSKLNRPLELEDFLPCQLTNLIMLGFAIGAKQIIDLNEKHHENSIVPRTAS